MNYSFKGRAEEEFSKRNPVLCWIHPTLLRQLRLVLLDALLYLIIIFCVLFALWWLVFWHACSWAACSSDADSACRLLVGSVILLTFVRFITSILSLVCFEMSVAQGDVSFSVSQRLEFKISSLMKQWFRSSWMKVDHFGAQCVN